MKKQKKKLYEKYMLRPILYMTATRMMVSFIFMLILVRFVKNAPGKDMVSAFLAVFFALISFLVYLRTDGLRIPRMKHIKTRRKKDPVRNYGDMEDHIDEEVVSFDELEDDEKDFCSLVSALINMALFLILSFLL